MNSIPINIWSVVLGSIIAFGGVLISNKSHTKRLNMQLEYDAKLKAVELKVTMRREVYLNAAEELVKANSYLGSLPQFDFTKTNIGEALQGFFISSAKLELVAEDETRDAMNKLVIAYSGIVFKLMIKMKPISDHKIKIDIIDKHYEESQVEIKRILSLMSYQNESGSPDASIFKALDSSLKFHQKQSKGLSDERNDHWDKVNDYTTEFALQLIDELKVINNLQTPVMVGIRKELDIETNVEDYEKSAKSNTDRITKQLDDFLISLNDKA